MLHRVQDEDATRDVTVAMSCEPIREDRVRGSTFLIVELMDLDVSVFQSGFEIFEFSLSLRIDINYLKP